MKKQVQQARGRPKAEDSRISADLIVEAAKRLTIETGKLASIRQIARELGVDPMAIYHYFRSKQALLESMSSSIVEGIYAPKKAGNWERELTKLAISYVDAIRQYPGLLEAMLANPVIGPVHTFSDRFESALDGLAMDENARRDALFLFVDYLHGFAYSATCAGDACDPLKTEEVARPLYLLFNGMKSNQTTAR